MNKSDGVCKICNVNDETLTHLFYECCHVKPVWETIEFTFNMMTTKDITLNAKLVILAIERGTFDITPEELTLCNLFILTTKWILWKHRNNVRFGTSDVLQANDIVNKCLSYCYSEIQILESSSKWYKCTDELSSFFIRLKDVCRNKTR